MTLKDLRIEKGLTQSEVAKRLGVSLRSYITYENNPSKKDTIKYKYFLEELNKINRIDENHGKLSINSIAEKCSCIFQDYDVKFCYLFGSYSRGEETEISDVDLLVSTSLTGLKFFGMVEELRKILKKKVDVLDIKQLINNEKLLESVLSEGVKIYEKK